MEDRFCNVAIHTIGQLLANHRNHSQHFHCRQPIYCVQQSKPCFHNMYFQVHQHQQQNHSSGHQFGKDHRKNLRKKTKTDRKISQFSVVISTNGRDHHVALEYRKIISLVRPKLQLASPSWLITVGICLLQKQSTILRLKSQAAVRGNNCYWS